MTFQEILVSVLQKMAPIACTPAKTCGCRWPFKDDELMNRKTILNISGNESKMLEISSILDFKYLGLHPARFGAIKLVAPPVLLLRMAVINILFIVLDKPLKSNHILLVKPLM